MQGAAVAARQGDGLCHWAGVARDCAEIDDFWIGLERGQNAPFARQFNLRIIHVVGLYTDFARELALAPACRDSDFDILCLTRLNGAALRAGDF